MRFLLFALFLACSTQGFADTLYAVDNTSEPEVGNVSRLWAIDTTTGAATQVVTLSQLVDGDITVLNGTIYVFAGGDDPGFATIDPVTGTVTVINGSDLVEGLAANSSVPIFYTDGLTSAGFNTITPGGSETLIGNPTGSDTIQDLAYDSVHGVLYGWNFLDSQLVTINTTSGVLTAVGSPAFSSPRVEGHIGYDWENNTLYLLANDNFYSLNTTTGAATLIGATGASVGFVGLADLPTPEPAPAALIGIGLAGLWLATRRRA